MASESWAGDAAAPTLGDPDAAACSAQESVADPPSQTGDTTTEDTTTTPPDAAMMPNRTMDMSRVAMATVAWPGTIPVPNMHISAQTLHMPVTQASHQAPHQAFRYPDMHLPHPYNAKPHAAQNLPSIGTLAAPSRGYPAPPRMTSGGQMYAPYPGMFPVTRGYPAPPVTQAPMYMPQGRYPAPGSVPHHAPAPPLGPVPVRMMPAAGYTPSSRGMKTEPHQPHPLEMFSRPCTPPPGGSPTPPGPSTDIPPTYAEARAIKTEPESPCEEDGAGRSASEEDGTQPQPPAVPKRKRGRPRKNGFPGDRESMLAAYPGPVERSAPQRRRGRPPKGPQQKRGRPRTVPVPSESSDDNEGEVPRPGSGTRTEPVSASRDSSPEWQPAVKRKRGRPRKGTSPSRVEPPVKRKRGRPRKVPGDAAPASPGTWQQLYDEVTVLSRQMRYGGKQTPAHQVLSRLAAVLERAVEHFFVGLTLKDLTLHLAVEEQTSHILLPLRAMLANLGEHADGTPGPGIPTLVTEALKREASAGCAGEAQGDIVKTEPDVPPSPKSNSTAGNDEKTGIVTDAPPEAMSPDADLSDATVVEDDMACTDIKVDLIPPLSVESSPSETSTHAATPDSYRPDGPGYQPYVTAPGIAPPPAALNFLLPRVIRATGSGRKKRSKVGVAATRKVATKPRAAPSAKPPGGAPPPGGASKPTKKYRYKTPRYKNRDGTQKFLEFTSHSCFICHYGSEETPPPFPSYPELVEHMLAEHARREGEHVQVTCPACPHVFTTKSTRHASRLTDAASKVKTLIVQMLRHLVTKREEGEDMRTARTHETRCHYWPIPGYVRAHACPECASIHLTGASLASHMRVHKLPVITNVKLNERYPQRKARYTCEKCGRVLQLHSMREHARRCGQSVDSRRKPCPVCHKLVVRTAYHMQTVHSGAEYNLCHICSQKFKWSKSLEIHLINKHGINETGKELIHCEKCDFKCASEPDYKSHYKRHILIQCQKCPARINKADFSAHLKNVHTEPYLPCVHCGVKFKSKDTLRAHVFHVHGTGHKLKCEYCGMTTKYVGAFKKHVNERCPNRPNKDKAGKGDKGNKRKKKGTVPDAGSDTGTE